MRGTPCMIYVQLPFQLFDYLYSPHRSTLSFSSLADDLYARYLCSCMQDSFARARTRPKGYVTVAQVRRATIGHLVHKPTTKTRDDRVSCIQPLLARRTRPKGYLTVAQVRRATIGHIVACTQANDQNVYDQFIKPNKIFCLFL